MVYLKFTKIYKNHELVISYVNPSTYGIYINKNSISQLKYLNSNLKNYQSFHQKIFFSSFMDVEDLLKNESVR